MKHSSGNIDDERKAMKRQRRDEVLFVYASALQMLRAGDFSGAEKLRNDCVNVQKHLSSDRKELLVTMQSTSNNINTIILTIHIIQESQELVGALRHMLRGMTRFMA